jgi:hypothetical protein
MNTKLTFNQSFQAGLTAAGVSVLINIFLFFIFQAAGVITDSVMVQPNQPLTLLPVIISSIIPTLIGACVFFLIEKYTNNGFKIFSVVALGLVLLSLASPFMAVPGIPIAYGAVLDVMHLVVAFSLLYFIKRAKY